MNKLSTWQKSLYSKYSTITGLIVICFILIMIINVFYKANSSKLDVLRIENDIKLLEQKNEESRKLIEYYKMDDYVEIQAKSTLGMIKQGENSIIIPNTEIDKLRHQEVVLNSDVDINNYDFIQGIVNSKNQNYYLWWSYFFG